MPKVYIIFVQLHDSDVSLGCNMNDYKYYINVLDLIWYCFYSMQTHSVI